LSRAPARRRTRKPARPATGRAPGRSPSGWRRAGDFAALGLVGMHVGLLALMHHDGALPGAILVGFGVLSLLAFLAYARDKRAARLQARRTPELTLHLLELAGGWPGALLAQRALRHKNRKLAYQFAFWACVLLHETALGHLWTHAGTG